MSLLLSSVSAASTLQKKKPKKHICPLNQEHKPWAALHLETSHARNAHFLEKIRWLIFLVYSILHQPNYFILSGCAIAFTTHNATSGAVQVNHYTAQMSPLPLLFSSGHREPDKTSDIHRFSGNFHSNRWSGKNKQQCLKRAVPTTDKTRRAAEDRSTRTGPAWNSSAPGPHTAVGWDRGTPQAEPPQRVLPSRTAAGVLLTSGSHRPLPHARHPAGPAAGSPPSCPGGPTGHGPPGAAAPRAAPPVPSCPAAVPGAWPCSAPPFSSHLQLPASHTPHCAVLSRPHRSGCRSAPRTRHCPRWPRGRPLKAARQDGGPGLRWRWRMFRTGGGRGGPELSPAWRQALCSQGRPCSCKTDAGYCLFLHWLFSLLFVVLSVPNSSAKQICLGQIAVWALSCVVVERWSWKVISTEWQPPQIS